MNRNSTIIAIGLIHITALFYLLYKKSKSQQENTRESIEYRSDKPQVNFESYKRDNKSDNSDEFYSLEHLNLMRTKVELLDPDKVFYFSPNVKRQPFIKDSYICIDTESKLVKMIGTILANDKIISADIEQTNTNSYQGYNCLIQIASLNETYIVDAIILHDILPPYLKQIFENENIIKVFYGGTSDLLWLNRDYGIFVLNYFDVYYAAKYIQKNEDCSFVGLLKKYCDLEIEKDKKKYFQVSDWRPRPLTNDQLNYAALDVHYLIYLRNVFMEKLINERGKKDTTKFLTQLQKYCLRTHELKSFSYSDYTAAFDQEFSQFKQQTKKSKTSNMQGEELIGLTNKIRPRFISLCHLVDGIARDNDTNFDFVCNKHFLFNIVTKAVENTDLMDLAKEIDKLDHPELLKASNDRIREILAGNNLIDFISNQKLFEEKRNESKIIRKKAFEEIKKQTVAYENCQILSPDGELLSFTYKKKIKWYLDKDIATLVQEDPPIIQLKFKPSGNGPEITQLKKNYYTEAITNRVNQCVVCGQAGNLSKYHIVPVNYRQYFPPEMKNHRALDVILLCERCLEKANKEADKFKNQIAAKYNVPLLEFDEASKLQVQFGSLRKSVVSYNKHKDAMPLESKEKLEITIKELFSKVLSSIHISESTKKAFEQFEYNQDGFVNLSPEFLNYVIDSKHFKDILEKGEGKNLTNIHGKLVIEQLKSKDEIRSFIDEWRVYFVRSMDPLFLPLDLKTALSDKAAFS